MADKEDKTEEPTGKRLGEARKKGQIGKSQDLVSASVLLTALGMLWIFGKYISSGMIALMREYFVFSSYAQLNDTMVIYHFNQLAIRFVYLLGPLLLSLLILGLVFNLLQTGFLFTTHPLKPNFLKVFGMEGWKKLVSTDKLVELLKSVLKMGIVGWICYLVIMKYLAEYPYLADKSIGQVVLFTLKIMFEMMILSALLLLLLGIFDFFYQKHKHKKSLKMTKQEVKDEAKMTEGDPHIRSKLKSIRQEMYRKLMMKEVPKATVVVTNPTHIAIALRYQQNTDKAPMVVAKGKQLIAERIKKIAEDHSIPIIENKPLARSLYDVAQLGETIPTEFFGPVAEILAYVYRMKQEQMSYA